MPEQHVKLLTGLGLNTEQIDQLEKMTPEQLKEWKPDDLNTAVVTSVKNRLLNDNEFLNSIPEDKVPETTRKKIESGQYARFQNEIIEAAKKQLGLEDKDLADLTDDEKKSIKKTVTRISEKYLAKKGNVQGMQDMQKNVQELTTKLEAKDTEWQDKLTKQIEETNGKATAKMVKALTKVELASLDKIKLAVGAGFITEPVLAKLTEKYKIVLDANDNLDLKQKENDKLDVLVNGKKLSFSQALRDVVLQEKLGTEIKAEDDKGGGSRKTVIINNEGNQGGDSVELPSYIKDKIEQNIKLEKE
jgi:transcription termination factor NusB